MCGIVGIACVAPVVERQWLAEGCRNLAHRGPDHSGVWWAPDGHVGMAHQRLSIIDLSPAGHQPMHDSAGELHIVFNGEIYNFPELKQELVERGYSFRTGTDTEVILAAYRAWGKDCLSRFNGMFAFALYDAPARQVFLARDRAGEKPLFYRKDAFSLQFASELKALMADSTLGREVDRVSLDCYLTMGFVPAERSMLQGINKLPPAHALLFDLRTGQSRLWSYWRLPETEGGTGESDEEALLDELEALLQDAVRRQLVADVPVGVLLSGGMDSSLVTAMAARATSNVKTFTIRFPGHVKYDETQHARLIARHFGTYHEELEAEPTTVELLPKLARQFDEPLVDSSMIPTYLVTQLIRRHCTVALGGDGGDELFGGYSYYDRLLRLQGHCRHVPRPFRVAISRLAGSLLPVGLKGRNWLMAIGSDLQHGLPFVGPLFDHINRIKLLAGEQHWPFVAERFWSERTPCGGDLLDRATRMDFHGYLPEDILVKVDRASMLNSLEVRAPMLDVRIIEFAFGKVPSRLKVAMRRKKVFLGRLAERLLPPAFQRQRKQGFSIPLDSWLRSGPWLSYFREVLMDGRPGLFNRRFVGRLLDGQRRGLSNGERLFGLVMFELWRREYRVEI